MYIFRTFIFRYCSKNEKSNFIHVGGGKTKEEVYIKKDVEQKDDVEQSSVDRYPAKDYKPSYMNEDYVGWKKLPTRSFTWFIFLKKKREKKIYEKITFYGSSFDVGGNLYAWVNIFFTNENADENFWFYITDRD